MDVSFWDPYTKNQIDQLEKIQRSAARFYSKDYKYDAGPRVIDPGSWD